MLNSKQPQNPGSRLVLLLLPFHPQVKNSLALSVRARASKVKVERTSVERDRDQIWPLVLPLDWTVCRASVQSAQVDLLSNFYTVSLFRCTETEKQPDSI